jgi:hypothetical protein
MTSPTKQSSFFVGVAMDCFAALAMTFNPTVMPGLDPGIHRSSQEVFFEADGLPGQARQ